MAPEKPRGPCGPVGPLAPVEPVPPVGPGLPVAPVYPDQVSEVIQLKVFRLRLICNIFTKATSIILHLLKFNHILTNFT